MMTDSYLRLLVALTVFGLIIAWEAVSPRRVNPQRRRRWPVNLGLAVVNMALMKLTIGAFALFVAHWAATHQFGLFNLVPWPEAVKAVLAWLLLDLAIYGQHVAAHRWRWLWRLHQVHHSDLMFDASTAVRFHPLEIILSMLYKGGCVLLLGSSPLTVVFFEIMLNAAATFNHGNIRLPQWAEQGLRFLVITPDLHRIHHSVVLAERDSNYGFSISVWDRLFGTLKLKSQDSQLTMPIGLTDQRDPARLSLIRLLRMPWM